MLKQLKGHKKVIIEDKLWALLRLVNRPRLLLVR
jgi:hypothetical protein